MTRVPTLRRGRVSLREITAADETPIVAMFQDARVRRHLADPPRTRAAFRQFITWSTTNRLAGRYTGFAVRRGAETVGMMYVWVTAPGTAEIGFALQPSVWGEGVFQTAADLMCGFAFRAMKLHRLEMRIAVENRRAHAAVTRFGAVAEGLLREAFTKDGRRHDAVLYRLLASDARHRA